MEIKSYHYEPDNHIDLDPYFCEEDEFECWYTLAEFMDLARVGFVKPDDGGIAKIVVDGKESAFHLGIWMSYPKLESCVPITLEEFSELMIKEGHEVMIDWANK